MEDLINPALGVHPYGLLVYGFLVSVLIAANIVLWKANQQKDKTIKDFYDRMIALVEINTAAVNELKEVIAYLRQQR
jgi:hypothetical protein